MGRKLNVFENAQAALTDCDKDHQRDRAHLRQQYLARIAETLGITTAELDGHLASPIAIQSAIDLARQNEFALTRQCADLVKAFVQIQDPEDRLRCLQIVRDAALAKPPGSSC